MSEGPVMRASISDRARVFPPKSPRTAEPGRRGKGWTPRSMGASVAVSALWHLLVLAVLGLAVHPFTLPPESAAIDVQLIPPLPRDEPRPTPQVEPQPSPPVPTPKARAEPVPAPPRVIVRPPAPSPPPQPIAAPPAPAEAAPPAPVQLHRPESPRQKAIDLRPAPARTTPNLARQAPNLSIPAPPEVQAAPRPAPAPAPAKPVAAERPAPPAPTAQPSQAAPAPVVLQAPVQALTNDRVAPSPVLIAPPQRRPAAALKSEAPALPNLAPGAGEPAGGGGSNSGGGVPAGAGVLKPYGPITGDFVQDSDNGLRLRLGCASPDTYRMSAQDRAACLARLAQQAKSVPELNINIPTDKQARFDHQTACRAAVRGGGVPTSTSTSQGTSVAGLGDNPTLRQCAPGDR